MHYEVLLDSGSDRSYLDAEVATILGIKLKPEKANDVMGVGGNISLYYPAKVTLKIGDISYKTEVGFMRNLGGGIVPYGFVGTNGFFDRFIVKLDVSRNKIEVVKKS